MMRLQSKKIGIVLKVKQLGDIRILNEINRIMFEGAEILIIVLGHQDTIRPEIENPFFDLLVFIPCTGEQLSLLAETIPRDHNALPLVIAPILEKDSRLPLGDISALMDMRGIFFVPFGPLTRKDLGERQAPALFSRLDLLTESCIAALEGHNLKHSFWENNFFPG